MRRVAVFSFLLLCIAGVGYLMLQMGDAAAHRGGSHALAGADGRGGSDGASGAGAGAGDDGDRAGAIGRAGTDGGPGAVGRDDDPNRIDGPDVRIRGVVLADGKAAAGAAVAALRAKPVFSSYSLEWARETAPTVPIAETESGEDGGFELVIAPRRIVVLRATLPGFAFTTHDLLLPESGDPGQVTLRLERGHALRVLVVDENDAPVAQAQVSLEHTRSGPPLFATAQPTGEDGHALLEDLAPGPYTCEVRAEGYPALRRGVTVPERKDLRFALAPGGAMAGRVILAGGTPLAAARITVTTRDPAGTAGSGRVETVADAEGAYRAEPLAPGMVQQIVVEHPDVGRASSARELALPTGLVESGKDLAHDIVLEPGTPVTGRAVLAGTGAPAAGAYVSLLALNDSWRSLGRVAETVAGSDGRFRFPHVTEGTYSIDARLPHAARVVTRWSNDRPLTLDFYADGETAPPEQRVELEPTGTVRGRITFAALEPQTSVAIRNGPTGYLSALTDDGGRFLFPNVPPAPRLTVQTYRPQAESDPFAVVAGEVVEVEIGMPDEEAFAGRVENGHGEPIAGADVLALPTNLVQWNLGNFLQSNWGGTRSGDDGRFRFVPPDWGRQGADGTWTLVARKEGYGITRVDGVAYGKGTPEETRLVLEEAGTIQGRVEYEGGGPVAGARVVVTPLVDGEPTQTGARLPKGGVEMRLAGHAFSGLDGGFAVAGIGDGVYRASVETGDLKAEPVEVRAGDDEVRLVLRRTSVIAGVVVHEDGRPVASATVTAVRPRPSGPPQQTQGVLHPSGHFRVTHLEPGSYKIQVRPGDRAREGFEPKTVMDVEAGTEDLRIVVAKGPALRGRVREADGSPAAGAAVIAMLVEAPEDQQAKQKLQNAWRPAAIANGRGEFEIAGIREEVELFAMAPGSGTASLRAVPGGEPVELRLEAGATLRGRLLAPDGDPVPGAWISVNAKDEEVQQRINDWRIRGGQAFNQFGGWQMTATRTDDRGRFRLQGLPAGEYRIHYGSNDVQGVLMENTMRTGGAEKVLRLIEPLTISGRLVDPDGHVATAKGAYLNAARDGAHVGSAHVDRETGAFTLGNVPPGTITINVWANGYQQKKVDVEAGATDLVIVLEPVASKKSPSSASPR